MPTAKKIAVIGAGCSGLTAIKCCLDEGLEPVCIERTDHIGGLWYYTEDVRNGQACVMKSTVINTSKEMMSYSDFPIPKEFPIFMHNTSVLEYFNMYADHFDLRKHIIFNTEVVHIKQSSDFETTGRWDIKIKDIKTGQSEDLVFDGVLICTGHHAEKKEPKFEGLDEFEGKVIHSHDYKHSRGYEDKRIVLIGIGNSGADAAVELSRVASQLYLSTRRGSWVFNRVQAYGYPGDMLISNRFARALLRLLPINTVLKNNLNKRFDHAKYSLQPKHSPTAQHPTVNDDLPNRIISGSIIVKPNVKRFTKTGVEFDDGTIEENIDVVFLATGYIFGFPFLDKSVLEVKENKIELYKYMFQPNLAKQTLAVIGCFQPLGALMPISELQCRLFTRVFKGDVVLPSKQEMLSNIKMKKDLMAKRYVESSRHTIQVDYIDFMDELATLNGCRPDIGKLILRDPKLAWACYFHGCTPYQYRLMGPGKWSGAREAILAQEYRIAYPLKTRPLGFSEKSNKSFFLLYCLLIVILAAVVHFIFMK